MKTELEDKELNLEAAEGRTEASVRIEPSPRWVRGYVGGEPVVDSRRALLVWEPRRLPVYWFPQADARMELLEPSESARHSDVVRWNLRAGGRLIANAAWSLVDPKGARAPLAGHLAFYWNRLDAWFEEDDEVSVHPRDPHHRVDVLNSSRHVRIEIDGDTVAESRRPRLLFETGLPPRYYLPKQDVRMDLLEPTATSTRCPYKGVATYWSVRAGGRLHEDVVWSYPAPIPECSKIENLLSFYNEKVDIYVDGELQGRPQTPWS